MQLLEHQRRLLQVFFLILVFSKQDICRQFQSRLKYGDLPGFSTAMWKTCSKGNLLHNLDLACAKVEFVLLLVYFARFGGLNIWMQCFFPSFVVIMYTITDFFHERRRWLLNTWAHLIFRYIGYWWCHIALIREKKLWMSFLFLSFGYYTHIVLKMRRLSLQEKFDIDIEYISGVLEMLVVIGAFGTMHLMQIQFL